MNPMNGLILADPFLDKVFEVELFLLLCLCSFNQLCLPTYDSYEELHKMLKLAISEGSEGFGML